MNGKLKLNDLLRFSDIDIRNTKISLNKQDKQSKDDVIEIFKTNKERLLEWNYWNTRSYAIGQYVIGLALIKNDDWFLFTVGQVTGKINAPNNTSIGVTYNTLHEFDDLYGRVVINYHNTQQQMCRKAETLIDEMLVKEILPSVFSGFDFPGYDKVCLSFKDLELIVKGNYPSYQNALENQKAVYLQTDTKTGKLYVGSATASQGMLLKRWSDYVNNGHGGNKGLQALIKQEGFDYIKNNFQYTILENFNSRVNDEYVLARESYWKDVLKSREFGYNEN